MQRVNVNEFYVFGHTLHALAEVQAGSKLQENFNTILMAQSWLENILQGQIVPLSVSKPAGDALLQTLSYMMQPLRPEATTEEASAALEKEFGPFDVYTLTSNLATFETVLAAELQSLETYFVSKKLGYDTATLIEEAESLLPEAIRALIPDPAIEDMKQAGKCIAFEIPTAAGFHLIRATETVIRQYYEFFVGNPPKPKVRNWGAYIKKLRGTVADSKTLGFLDHIREAYRNPVLHPDEVLSTDAAQVLLGVCVSAIVMMVNEMYPL